MIKMRRIAIVAAVLAVAAASTAWLFRTRTDRDDSRGVIRYRWAWGRASEISVDRDRDGRSDLKVVYPRKFRDFAADDPPRELWADQDFDGRFDVMWRRGEDGLIVRRDDNDDGSLETELRGAEAERFKADMTLFK